MTEKWFEEIMDKTDSQLSNYKEDNALLGLLIIKKYLPERGVEAAEHDMIYGAEIEELVKAGITEQDVEELAKLNWSIIDDSLACFV